jgi:ATP-dependent Lon protease
MPITLSAIPKKSTKTKKQEDATRTYKSNLNGPGPNAPQPPSPESEATTDNEEAVENGTATAAGTAAGSAAATASAAVAAAVTPGSNSRSKRSKNAVSNLAQRLEVNHLLADLYPSKHINQKVAALEALSELVSQSSTPATPTSAVEASKKKTRSTKKTNAANSATANATTANATTANAATINTMPTEDPVAKAILDSAFQTPPASPPSATNAITAPGAPSKPKNPHAASKQKQKYNIIIHVEPNTNAANSDISRRLDFGNKNVENKVVDSAKSKSNSKPKTKPKSKLNVDVDGDDDDSDEDYVPEYDESDDAESWSTYDSDDEYYDGEDDEYEDDSYYSSESSDDDEDDAKMEELDRQQQKFTEEMKMLQSLRATYEDLLIKDKSNRIVAKQLKTLKASEEKIKTELDELMHQQKRKNSKKFRKLLRRKNSTNDLEYFKTRLTLSEQRAMIAEMNAVAQVTDIAKPYKLTLLESDIPRDMKAVAIRKIGMLQYMEPGCGEYCKLKNWVDAFMQIPFNQNKNLPITIADGVDKCHEFMTDAKNKLDTAVYGLTDAKMQIMQMVGQWIANPAAIGTAVAIHGPPGTGKTSLVKEGISKILGRDFAFIALGGATDSSFLEGHSYTYEGSMWGKIVDILIRCKSSNPVIYFDELDKISETSKGEEIVGILTHLTDTSQNSQFHDKYFSEVSFDLSKCLFIFSYNDESRVNPVLLDRMYKIRTTGYGTKDKTFIAQNYLIPRICTEVAFAKGDINIPDNVVEHIVEHHTHKEAGVRNLKRGLETIYTKLNLHRLMRPGTQLFDEKEKSFEVSFPYTVTCDVVDKLIKKNADSGPNLTLYL